MRIWMLSALCSISLLTLPQVVCAVDLQTLDRTIAREPEYKSQPGYCLLAFGSAAETRVWLVEDGPYLFVDRNANSDLTDDGPPVPAIDERELATTDFTTKEPITLRDCDYEAGKISPGDGSSHTDLKVMRWQFGSKPVQHGVLLKVDGRVPVYSGWGHVFATSPKEAPIMHFGGNYEVVPLRQKKLQLGKKYDRFSIGMFSPGFGDSSSTRISIDAIEKEVVPQCEIDWPTTDADAEPLRTTFPLPERCCYWEFYTTSFAIPPGVEAGTAKVTITFPDKLPFHLTKQSFEMPVTAAAATEE
jgi:hypothetical protein